jgi:hypothetical protein
MGAMVCRGCWTLSQFALLNGAQRVQLYSVFIRLNTLLIPAWYLSSWCILNGIIPTSEYIRSDFLPIVNSVAIGRNDGLFPTSACNGTFSSFKRFSAEFIWCAVTVLYIFKCTVDSAHGKWWSLFEGLLHISAEYTFNVFCISYQSVFMLWYFVSHIKGWTILRTEYLREYFDPNTIRRKGCAVAQAVSCCLPTTAARVRIRAACGFSCGQSGTGVGFLRVFRFPLSIILPISPSS